MLLWEQSSQEDAKHFPSCNNGSERLPVSDSSLQGIVLSPWFSTSASVRFERKLPRHRHLLGYQIIVRFKSIRQEHYLAPSGTLNSAQSAETSVNSYFYLSITGSPSNVVLCPPGFMYDSRR